MEREVAWKSYTEEEMAKVQALGESYKAFLSAGKTERECVKETVRLAKKKGFKDLAARIASGKKLKAGEKLYYTYMDKCVMLFIAGSQPLEKGMNIIGAHIDSPRLDVKQNPLYESDGLAYMDTHYYGGIKSFQWLTLPLAIHGVVVKKDGSVIELCVGEDDKDPVFCISDILPHLGQDQMKKSAAEFIDGEQLDIIIGGSPLKGEEKDAVKANALKLLKDKYGFEEEDFLSAELEIVPAGKARDLGFDRALILGYGHDDRVCAYAQIEAMFAIDTVPEKTVACILTDKEEIGSVGATGMRARYFENAVAELMELNGESGDLRLRRALAASSMLSCDVSAGFDPAFAGAFEKKNETFLGRGVCFNKFTGSRGKSGSNDANAEFMARCRAVMDEGQVKFQTAELGKVNQGGGGTIAYICALYGMKVIDSGVAVLSMHAPWEIISKADLYESARAYKAFALNA
ncbi:MAG: aminopeptidase [Clostridia bacterium]|nr:aminopeptidase [Clostridia bacterium]